jgi:hypothetical protein
MHPTCLDILLLGARLGKLDQALKKTKGGFEYNFAAIDKFTKWSEYKHTHQVQHSQGSRVHPRYHTSFQHA